MTLTDDAHAQLRGELFDRLHALAALGPPDRLLEVDQQASDLAARTFAPLTSDNDAEASDTAAAVMAALWPEDIDPPHDWWHSPLGRLVARTTGHRDDTDAVTYSVAAAMLGVTRGAVSQWVSRGTLDRHPDGGVLRGSVMQRLGR